MTVLEVTTADEMRRLGVSLARQLKHGDVIVLTGSLGAGKTTFVQGLGMELGVKGDITSPTFVVAREYNQSSSGLGLIHVDAYRLRDADDLVDLDLDADWPHVTVIEWGAPFVQHVTDSWLSVSIERTSDDDETAPENGIRTVSFASNGPQWQERTLEVSL